MKNPVIEGVIAAVPTPFLANGTPDLEQFIHHCHWCLANGADGINVLGTTGEANSQNVAARRQIMKEAANQLDAGTLMVGTATPDLETTVELTQYASDLGYPVALVLPPYYYKPVTESGLFGWFEELDRRLGSASIQLYLYNFPALTGIGFSVDLIARLAKELNGRVSGIKDSSADLPYCREIVNKVPGFKVFLSMSRRFQSQIGLALTHLHVGGYQSNIRPNVKSLATSPETGCQAFAIRNSDSLNATPVSYFIVKV